MLGVGVLFLLTWMPYVAAFTVHSHSIPLFHGRCAVGVLDRWVDGHFAVFLVDPCHPVSPSHAHHLGDDAHRGGGKADAKGCEWVVPGRALRTPWGQQPEEGDWGYLVARRTWSLPRLSARSPVIGDVLFVKNEAKTIQQTETARRKLERLRRE